MVRSATRSLASRAGSVARRVVGKKAAASGGSAKQAAPKKSAAKQAAPAKKAVAKKSVAKKAAPAKKAVAKKSAAKKSVAKKVAPVKKAVAKKAVSKKAVSKAVPAKPAAAKTTTPARKAVAKKATPVKEAPPIKKAVVVPPEPAKQPTSRARKGSPASLVVLPSEKPWTKAELEEVKAHLRADIKRLAPEVEVADEGLHNLMIDSGDGAGNDQADVGSSTFERDHEMTIVNNARDMLEQSRHALERIEDGSYGVCESRGEPIGKMRLLAFPRATLCMACKQREERR